MRFGVLAICAVALVGCAGGGGEDARPTDAAPRELAASLRGDFTGDAVEAAEVALVRAGATVLEDDFETTELEGAEPRSPFAFTRFQARNMALEATAGGGFLGADLDALVSRPDPVGLAALFATEIRQGESEGARIAAALMEGESLEDPTRAVFPTLALALVLSELARGAEAAEGTGARLIAAAGGCGEVREFVGSVGTEVARHYVRELPYARDVIAALGVAAVLVEYASILREWSVRVDAIAPSAHYQVGGAPPVRGEFKATVESGTSVSWPPAVRDCASFLDVELPQTRDAPGSTITWANVAGIPQHGQRTRSPEDARVRDDGTAISSYQTSREPEQDHASGDEQRAVVQVRATVLRPDTQQVARNIGRIPPYVAGLLPGALAGAIAEAVLERLVVEGVGTLGVTYHAPGPMSIDYRVTDPSTFVLHGWNCDGVYGTWNLRVRILGQGSDETTFVIPEGGAGRVSWTIPISGGTYNGAMTVTPVGTEALSFRGSIVVITPLGSSGKQVFDRGIPLKRGAPECG